VPRTALALNVVFLLLAVGWRGLIQYRRTGDVGFRKPMRGAARREKLAGVLLAVGAVGVLLSPACSLVGTASPIRIPDRSAVHMLGLLLACSGIALTVLAEFQMGDSWRVGVDPSESTSLVKHGLFGSIRNPIYSGMLLFSLGIFCLVPSLVSGAAGVVLVLGVELQVRGVEEPYLVRRHGGAYRHYARAAGRFVPGIGRLS
jgi:protein-S-isoprenylcysteine O-methyltransferase Ste14